MAKIPEAKLVVKVICEVDAGKICKYSKETCHTCRFLKIGDSAYCNNPLVEAILMDEVTITEKKTN
jgi:hypothetical protein